MTTSYRHVSFFLAGALVGLAVATFGFALFVRHQNTSGTSASQTVLKLAHGLDQKHPVHQALLQMGEILSQKSGGKVVLQVFPNGQLGSETDCIEQLQRGALAMTKTSAAPMESFVAEMAVFGVPHVFRDADHYWKVLQGDIGRQLMSAGQVVGLRGLCYFDAGARSFYTIDKPILSPDDLRGLKIRVQKSKTAMDMVKAMGGSPTPIPWGELYTALQQRMVDGAENNLPSFYSNRHFEVCKQLSLNEHTRVPDILLCSEKVWNNLTSQVQQWLQEAANESSLFQRGLWQEETKQALAAVKQEGVTVHYPDKQRFADKVAPMHAAYEGTNVGRLLEQIQQQ